MVFSGAAPLGGEIEKAVRQRLNCNVKQADGMTELSPASHYSTSDTVVPGSIGFLLPNSKCKIVDLKTGESLPVGKEGELCVKGPQVMKGNDNFFFYSVECLGRIFESSRCYCWNY